MSTLWLALALLATDGGGGPRFEGSVAAGGGWDAALLVAPGTGALGSAVGAVTATGGTAFDLAESMLLHVGTSLDGTRYPSLPELDNGAARAAATLYVGLADPLVLAVGFAAGYGWYADPARSGASLAARASLRWRPARPLTLRTGYAHVARWAADPVYGYDVDRIHADAEFQLGETTYLSLGASGERGDATFYAEESGALDVTAYVPYRSPATTLGASVSLELGLGSGLFLETTAALRRTWTPEGAVTGPAGDVALGWRWN